MANYVLLGAENRGDELCPIHQDLNFQLFGFFARHTQRPLLALMIRAIVKEYSEEKSADPKYERI